MTYLIAAAGTGGHVYPGLAVGSALEELGVDRDRILFVGGDRLEAEVYPAEGFQFLGVELQGLKRSLSPSNLKIPRLLRRAAASIAEAMTQRRVRVALAMGGYVTIPTAMAAKRVEAELMLAEQNAGAGLANRVAGRGASRQFVAFPDTKGLPRGEWVGNPVRRPIREFDRSRLRDQALTRYRLEGGAPVLGVFGGSLGASAINEAIADVVLNWDASPVQVLHLSGERDQSRMKELAGRASQRWIVLSFEREMAHFYAASDLVVSRSGGGVAELTATGTPSILVPGEFGSSGHQKANARFLEDAGAAVVVEDAIPERIAEHASRLLFDESRLRVMGRAARSVAKPDAALTIAKAMIEET